MEIRQLRYFIAVADTLNFSRAAESVYLSQSALSRQIMDLEKEVGLPLLRRSTRQVELTEAGKALQKGAKELISRWEKMLPEVRNQVAEEAQALSLTIGVDAGRWQIRCGDIDFWVQFMKCGGAIRGFGCCCGIGTIKSS